MTFSIHKIILASVTLLFTFITAFVFPPVTTQIASAGQAHQEDIKEPLEVPQFTRVSTVSVAASPEAKINFERASVKTIPGGPTPEEIAAEKAKAEQAAKEAADKVAAENAKAEQAATEKAKQEQAVYYASTQNSSAPVAAAQSLSGSPAASTPDAPAASGDTSVGASKAFAKATLASRGMGDGEFQCLNNLWERESNWNFRASNASSGAYGIPQSLPGSKMGSIAGDWQTNPQTQILWGIGYISERYGSPCNAWGHSQTVGWY
jgi:hypothetical protein